MYWNLQTIQNIVTFHSLAAEIGTCSPVVYSNSSQDPSPFEDKKMYMYIVPCTCKMY